MQKTTKRKTLMGLVVSNKMDKTVVVKVELKFIHPKFKAPENTVPTMKRMNAVPVISLASAKPGP